MKYIILLEKDVMGDKLVEELTGYSYLGNVDWKKDVKSIANLMHNFLGVDVGFFSSGTIYIENLDVPNLVLKKYMEHTDFNDIDDIFCDIIIKIKEVSWDNIEVTCILQLTDEDVNRNIYKETYNFAGGDKRGGDVLKSIFVRVEKFCKKVKDGAIVFRNLVAK